MVYICSPLRGDIERNIVKAQGYCRFASNIHGVLPIAPHIYCPQYLDELMKDERELGLQQGLELLKLCQELWVFGHRVSDGMKAEIDLAHALNIPVYYYSDRCEKVSGFYASKDQSN